MPRLLVVAGSPCGGKTTLAALACKELGGACLVDKDTLEWPLANAALVAGGEAPDAHDCEFYAGTLKALAYETCFRVCEQNCKAGNDVVLVAPFTSHTKDPAWLQTLANRCGADAFGLAWVTAAPAVLRARKAARNAGRDAAELASAGSSLADAEAARQAYRPPGPHAFVDTSDVTEEAMGALASRVVAEAFRGGAPEETRRVLCCGHACVDVVLRGSDDLPSREGYAAVDAFELRPGGSVSNVAHQLALLGAGGGLAADAHTTLGVDGFGDYLVGAWRTAGVGTARVARDAACATGAACLPVYRSDGKRAVYCAQGWNARLELDAAALGAYDVATIGYPHVMGPALRGAPLRALVTEANARGCCVCLDVNEASDDAALPLGDARDAYGAVGLFHGNLDEAAACAGLKAALLAAHGLDDSLETVLDDAAVENVARKILDRGAGLVLVTLGPRGCFGAAGDEARLRHTLGRACPRRLEGIAGRAAFRRAFAVEGTVDSVGAGDAFLAGAVAALLRAADDAEAAATLEGLLDAALASACFRVDTARGDAPDVGALLARAAAMPRLP